jgi:hypothetical protein
MLQAFARAFRLVFNVAVIGTNLIVAALALSSLDATAAEVVTKALANGLTYVKPGVIAMQPIPDGPVLKAADPVTATGEGEVLRLATEAAKPAEAKNPHQREVHCLTTALYFEARGESAKGQKAVAEVIIARTRVPGRPKTVCGVVYEGSQRATGCQFSFTCDGYSDVAPRNASWKRASKIAAAAMRARGRGKQVVRGATFYHADYVSPGWASRMVKVAKIGQHIFYKPKRGQLF